MVPPVLSDGLMMVVVEMLNAGAAPVDVPPPPLLPPPPPHAARASAPAAATAASLAELRTFLIGLDRLPWVTSDRPSGGRARQTVPCGPTDSCAKQATERYGGIREIKYCGKGLSSIRDPAVVFAQTSEVAI